MGLLLFPAYLFLKWIGYSAWVWVGLTLLNPSQKDRLASAFKFGTYRVMLGLGFGLLIFGLSLVVWPVLYKAHVPHRDMIVYLLVYVPVRWVEWSIVTLWIEPHEQTFSSFFLSNSRASAFWRLGGIGVSCIADLPMILHGLPIGRFLC